jgi:hypothetical protein
LPRSSRLKALGVAPLRPDPSPAWTCPIRAARFESSLPQSPEFRAREEYLQFRKSKARRRSVDGIANASGHDPVRAIDGETDRVPRLRGSSRLNSNPLGWAPAQKSSEKNPPDCVLVHCAATKKSRSCLDKAGGSEMLSYIKATATALGLVAWWAVMVHLGTA